MRSIPLILVLAGSGAVFAQPLTCPQVTNISGRPCEVFHYHVLMYRPDTRGFAEAYGINQFASQPACDHAREAEMARNLALVDTLKKVANEQQYQPDQFGPCHCDMTVEKTSPNFLTDLQRVAQIRQAEEVRGRVKEHLLGKGLTTDSDAVRGLDPLPAPNAFLQGPRLLPLPPPQQVAASGVNSADDLRPTKSAEDLKAAPSNIDLPLVDVSGAPAAEAVSEAAPQTTDTAAGTSEENADAFVSLETQRVQDVLKSSGTMTDEALKSKILQSCMQRIQLLSNLRRLIEGSGARSRLATEARTAHDEPARLALVVRLFGSDISPHWAPKNAADLILPAAPDVDGNPERVLRDTSNRYNDQQKKRALYLLLAQSQPTEDQQLWLSTIVDSFLR